MTTTVRDRNGLLAVFVMTAVLTLAGCGGGGSDSPAPSSSTADVSSPTGSSPVEQAAPTELDNGKLLEGVAAEDTVEETLIGPEAAPPAGMGLDEGAADVQTQAAASRRCWNTPARWLGQVQRKDTDVVNLIVCLGHGVTWDRVFAALGDLPGRKFQRHWPWPPVNLPWKQVRHPANPPLFRNGHCINAVQANLDQRGWQNQAFSAREGGCLYILGSGMNHFRVWQQQSSQALFIAASTEERCELRKHCVVSYNDGRNLLFRDLQEATAKAGLKMSASYVDAIRGGGSLTQEDGRSVRYDGTVGIVTISR